MTLRADSIDKVVMAYFAAVAAEPFVYKGVYYPVRKVVVNPNLLRGYVCPPGCGACCYNFTLDYLPDEPHPYPLKRREVLFDGRRVELFTDTQEGNVGKNCHNLLPDTIRCGIHGKQPFACDFELIKSIVTADVRLPIRVTTQLFSRKWGMTRVGDGQKGALCYLTPPSPETQADILRKLHRLERWCDHFGLKHRVRYIIEWASGSPQEPLVFPAQPASQPLFTTKE